MVAPPLEIHDMTVAYHRKPVLWDIDLTVPEGKLIGIVTRTDLMRASPSAATTGTTPTACVSPT